MPRRMREQVVRDREAAVALARLRERQRHGEPPIASDEDVDIDAADLGARDLDPAAAIREATGVRRGAVTAGGAHRIDESDADLDVDALLASAIHEGASTTETAQPRRTTGQMRAATARAKTDPGASAEPAQPRRTTGQMRAATARAKTDPGASA